MQRLTADDTEISTTKLTFRMDLWKIWPYEFLAVGISAISFACLVATLHSLDGRPQQEWSYHHVTRNTVIAAISTITRASLLGAVAVSLCQNKWTWFSTSHRRGRKLRELETFDSASRGVSGSLQLLGTIRHNHIASLGALVTILALGFDTFAQNILGLENRPAHHLGGLVGSIPRSEIYNASNAADSYRNYNPNFDLTAAISNGLLGGSIPIPSPDCFTGNCTWPVVPSLAMCGGCVNVTESLARDCSRKYCNYSLPDGTSMSGPKAGTSMADFGDVALPLFSVSSAPHGHVYRDVFGTTGRIYTARFSTINTWMSDITPEDNLLATECALWFCMRAYNTSIRSGLRDEKLISEWDIATPLNLTDIGYITFVGPRNFTNIPPEFNINDDMVFGTTYPAVNAINSSISRQIAGNVTWNGFHRVFGYSSANAQSLWNARKDLDAWTKNLAPAMTTVIRTNGTTVNPDESIGDTPARLHRWKHLFMFAGHG